MCVKARWPAVVRGVLLPRHEDAQQDAHTRHRRLI